MVPSPSTLSSSHARELFDAVVAADTRDGTGRAATALLNFLLQQLEALRTLANGYPRNPIAANVWSDGKSLAELSDELVDVLAERAFPELEELASRIAAGMACQVMAHYPEEIFPRVVRNARCREAIGQVAEAIGSYRAVLSDFHQLELMDLLDEEEELGPTARIILLALSQAVGRLSELQPERRAPLEGLASLLARRLEPTDP